MFEKERELVEVGPHSYNLKEGGNGGWSHLTKEQVKGFGYLGGVKVRNLKLGIFKIGHKHNRFSKESQKKRVENAKSDTAVKKRKETMIRIKHQQGLNNSQYGTMWITDGTANRKIKKEDVIPEGWRKGRVIKIPVVAHSERGVR